MKNFTLLLCLAGTLFLSNNAYSQVPKLNSLSGIRPTIFLDFDGHTVQSSAWQSGTAFICAASGMTTTQMTEIFNRVSEDYRPFNVNITTDSTRFLSAPVTNRIRIIVTPTSAWYAGVGGIAYINSFTWGDDTPGFVFTNRLSGNPKYIADACSHESGHSLGLSHQSKYDSACHLTETYNSGVGSGETGWAPLMGNSYTKNMSTWVVGPTPYDCADYQDNISIITTNNGFGLLPDDYTATLDNTTAPLNPVSFNKSGVISSSTDKDAFKFTLTTASNMHIDVKPFDLAILPVANDGANVDIKVCLFNGAKVMIRTYDPAQTMSVTIDTALPADTYYMVISGGGNNTANFGGTGSYTVSGYKGTLPIHDVALRGNVEKANHRLNWNIVADEPILNQVLEVSYNGTDFKSIMNAGAAPSTYTWRPDKNGQLYYRLKVTSVIYESKYSNIVSLKSENSEDRSFRVATLIRDNAQIIAKENYAYTLTDMNGRTVGSGKGTTGITLINTANLAKGMYIIKMMSENNIQTERIIKQ